MCNLIIVHGEKLQSNGQMEPEFKERLDQAIALTLHFKPTTLVITGGKTRKGYSSEADIGYRYLKNHIRSQILLEPHAKTTAENIIYTKKLVSKLKFNQIFVITSQKRVTRVRYLYYRLWKEIYPSLKFIGTKDYYPRYYSLLEWIYLLNDIFDPQGKTFEYLGKIIFRNGLKHPRQTHQLLPLGDGSQL